ncbi:MAG: dihydroorotate dehydrogenase electron transfer subunit [Ruminococcaceae bacterium]|nr:dihydroorotate dehydrogenase electron transfer subunit [Oscillospiraceae bacterium]
MTTESIFTIISNEKIAKNTYKMVLSGTAEGCAPGKFVNIQIDGFFLRRPISVCDQEGDKLTLVYKAVGKGTEKMAAMTAGEKLNVLAYLGNGYDLSKSGDAPLLIGGGVGVPPLYMCARKLCSEGKNVTVILGFNTAEEVFYKDEFEALGARVLVATADGSVGTKGFVTDAMKEAGEYSYFYTCGPEPMLKAVYAATATSGEFSFEERMGCGFGACVGCTCKTKYGNKRICKDGPVLVKEEIIW